MAKKSSKISLPPKGVLPSNPAEPWPWAVAAGVTLASASPRRLELLRQVGLDPHVLIVPVDENPLPGEPPAALVERLARLKAETGRQEAQRLGLPPRPVLGADTAVTLGRRILGKPADASEAHAMLRRLSGRRHRVWTGVAAAWPDGPVQARVSVTSVWFKPLSDLEIQRYVTSGEPLDKAGAYGIQGLGAFMVARIRGSYSGVVGLPLFETLDLLTPPCHFAKRPFRS
ncbi:MAG: septum formation inhibitor Maf [Magnetococcales bacterium]|nr:septum formation inhibitor Maf [Magnetococcales bacterium]